MSGTADQAFRRALALMDAGNHPAAIDPLRDVLTQDPGNALAHLLLARCLRAQNRIAGAAYEAEQAIAIDPLLAPAHLEYAQALYAQQHRRRALERVDEAIALDPQNASGHLVRARMLRAGGRTGEASASLDRALALAPGSPVILGERGHAAVERGDMATAEAAARAVIAQAPDHPDGLVVMGHVRLAAGDDREALRLALSALQVAPSDVDALALLAAAKMRRSMIGGLWWRWNRLLVRLGETRSIFLIVAIWVVYRWASLAAEDAGLGEGVSTLLTVAYLAFVFYTMSAQAIVNRLIAKEFAKVRLNPAF